MIYPKKFGFTRRRITHEAHSNARDIATHLMRSLHFLASHVVHNTHATIKTKKHTINITVISILISQATSIGNAFASVIVPEVQLFSPSCIQFHIKGTLVFNFTPQQTVLPSHGLHTQSTLVLFWLQTHIPKELAVSFVLQAKVKPDTDNITNQNNTANSFFVMIWFG